MGVYYVAGGKPAGTAGAIEKVIDDSGKVWFDNLATGNKIKVAGWSNLANVQKFKTITEGNGTHQGER